jgi:transcription elongation GreA/GreB family factor
MTYTVVGSYEADPLAGKISDESPLGKAFMGKKVGEKVNVDAPAGKITYEILEIG